jgi:aminoglycoside phosphotransferase (APT) family kinase protein
MVHAALTAEIARAALAGAGYRVSAEGLALELRDERWLARLPDGNLAWFPATSEGERRLQIERRVLRLIASRCTFRAPRVVFEAPDRSFDVRVPVPGAFLPWELYARLRQDDALAARIGAALGAVLAEQHTRITASDVLAWLPVRTSWPLSRSWIEERLPQVIDDRELERAANALMARYEAVQVPDANRALVHGDLGVHNIAVDPGSFALRGVFDYDGAAWADRHHDFQYMVFDFDGFALLEAASAAYQAVTGYAIDRGRVLLYNAACAISFLGFRAGTAPDQRSAGRTLEEDVRWVSKAIERVAPGER